MEEKFAKIITELENRIAFMRDEEQSSEHTSEANFYEGGVVALSNAIKLVEDIANDGFDPIEEVLENYPIDSDPFDEHERELDANGH